MGCFGQETGIGTTSVRVSRSLSLTCPYLHLVDIAMYHQRAWLLEVLLFIKGRWTPGVAGETIPLLNPATGQLIGNISHAEITNLDLALASAENGFPAWRRTSAFERSEAMRKAADLERARAEEIVRILTTEQSKPGLNPRPAPSNQVKLYRGRKLTVIRGSRNAGN